MVSLDWIRGLERELSCEIGCRFDDSPFVRERCARIQRLSVCPGAFTNPVELECEADTFSGMLLINCKQLKSVDFGLRMIDGVCELMKTSRLIRWMPRDVRQFSIAELLILIVLEEGLCCLNNMTEMGGSPNLARIPASDRYLIFVSARDVACGIEAIPAGADAVSTMVNDSSSTSIVRGVRVDQPTKTLLLARFRDPARLLIQSKYRH